MPDAFICDAIRTPIGRYGGNLSSVRTDDLAAIPISELMNRNPKTDWEAVDDVIYGCVNQAGEDNRNVARMGSLLAGLPDSVPGVTVNRLCGSGMHAVASAAQSIRTGEADLLVAGGVESMSRSPFVMPKSDKAFSRNSEIYDTTIGWRFINPKMNQLYGTDSMGETAENVAEAQNINREDQDKFASDSQTKTKKAQDNGNLAEEITSVKIFDKKGNEFIIDKDEHPRADTDFKKLSSLKPAFRKGGTVTAGNSSGVNDGACALLIASEKGAVKHGLKPRTRILGMASAGVPPRVMGIGPVPATEKLLNRLGLTTEDMAIIELNEAFAAQSLGVLRSLGIDDNDPRVNPQGGAIALGHPLGASGARLLTTATYQLLRNGGSKALCTMCVGVGQGISTVIEKV